MTARLMQGLGRIRILLFMAVIAAGGIAAPSPSAAQVAYNTLADHAILIEMNTGEVLFAKNPDEPIPPASMSKLMTLYMAFEMLKEGSLTLEQELPVSEKAWRMGGSKMFVEVGDTVSVEDLLRGIIVQSGNDACVVLAEGIAGSEQYFATLMNEKARALGLESSHFENATGWPEENHVMSVRDIARLSERIIREFPEYYPMFAERSFTYGVDVSTGQPITQSNRNPLLFRNMGVDGLKTGHTEEAGYGLAGSALRDGRRLVFVVAGLDSERERARESARLLEFGFSNFDTYTLFSAGEKVDEASVWLGAQNNIGLIIPREVRLTMTRRARQNLSVRVVYDQPVPAPIQAGQEIGEVHIDAPSMEPLTVPLLADRSVGELPAHKRLFAAFRHLLFGESVPD